MKNTLFLILSFFSLTSLTHANENWFYGSAQTMGALPMVGIGLRSIQGSHGLDLSGNVCPINNLSPVIFHAKGQYLFYPVRDRLYFGGGLGILNEPELLKRISGSFESTLGLQWKLRGKNSLFIEGNIIVPFETIELAGSKSNIPVWPGFSAGFGF